MKHYSKLNRKIQEFDNYIKVLINSDKRLSVGYVNYFEDVLIKFEEIILNHVTETFFIKAKVIKAKMLL